MLIAEYSKRDIHKCKADDTSLHIRGGGPLGYDQFRKRCAISRNTDVLLKRFDVHREIEGQPENCGGVIATGNGIVHGAFCEAQLEVVEFNGLDDIELPSIREDGLDNEALDALVQPRNLLANGTISITAPTSNAVHSHLGVQHCLRGRKHCCLVRG